MTGIHQALAGGNPGPATLKLADIISGTVGTSSLNLVLDAGDINSYSGSGQQWSDVSGQSNHFWLGASNAVETATGDPLFVGTAGSLGEVNYFTGNSGGGFTAQANSTFIDPWCKAGGTFTVILYFWCNVTSNYRFFDGRSTVGPIFNISTTGFYNINCTTSNTPTATATSATLAYSLSVVNMIALSYTVGGSSFFYLNGVQDTPFTAPTSTLTTNAATPLITPPTSADSLNSSAKRVYGEAMFSRALSLAELNLLYTYSKQRFTSMP
jgi:hypothetical protein